MKVLFHAGSLSCAFAFPLARFAVDASGKTGPAFATGTQSAVRETAAPAMPSAFGQAGPVVEPMSEAGSRKPAIGSPAHPSSQSPV